MKTITLHAIEISDGEEYDAITPRVYDTLKEAIADVKGNIVNDPIWLDRIAEVDGFHKFVRRFEIRVGGTVSREYFPSWVK